MREAANSASPRMTREPDSELVFGTYADAVVESSKTTTTEAAEIRVALNMDAGIQSPTVQGGIQSAVCEKSEQTFANCTDRQC